MSTQPQPQPQADRMRPFRAHSYLTDLDGPSDTCREVALSSYEDGWSKALEFVLRADLEASADGDYLASATLRVLWTRLSDLLSEVHALHKAARERWAGITSNGD